MRQPARVRRRVRQLVVFFGVMLAAVFALAAPAFAHADLERSDPASGVTLPQGPKAVELTFTEGVAVRKGGIRLLDAGGEQLAVGNPTYPGDGNRVVRVSVPTLGDGLYVVAWRATSEDSHPIRGAFTFFVGDAHVSGKHAELLAEAALSEDSGDPAVGVVFGVARFGVFLGMALLLGAGWFAAYLWPEGRSDRRVRSLLVFSIGLTAVSTVFGFLLQGPYTSGGGFSDMFSSDQLSAVWDTRFGKVWVLRLVLLVFSALLMRMMIRHRGPLPRWWFGMAGLVGLALSATPGLAGHASTGRWVLLALPADMLHVLGMSAWLGGLIMLAIARTDEHSYARVAERFSGLALGAVVALVITGSFQAIRQLQPISALWDSDYGRLLIAKLVAFALLIGVAAWSRRLVHGPGMGVFGNAPASEAAAPALGSAVRLKRSVRGEIAIGAIVLALTSMLVNTSPPKKVATATPFEQVIDAGAVKFDTFFGPAKVGVSNALHITVLSRSLEHADAKEVRASLSMPSRGISRIPIKLVAGDHGHFAADDVRVPFAGEWRLEIHALLSEVDEASATVPISVR